MRSNARRHCLVCDQLISRHTERRSIFKCSSNMDEVAGGLSDRLEVILDTKLAENQAHSEELCHLCEAQMVQIEEYFRLLIIFRETYRQTVKKHIQSQSLSQQRGKANRQRKQESFQSNKESRQKSQEGRSRLQKRKKTSKSQSKTRHEKQNKDNNTLKLEEAKTTKPLSRESDTEGVTSYLSDYDVDTEDNCLEEEIEYKGGKIANNDHQNKANQQNPTVDEKAESKKQSQEQIDSHEFAGNKENEGETCQDIKCDTETDRVNPSAISENNSQTQINALEVSEEENIQIQPEFPLVPATRVRSQTTSVLTTAKPPLQRFIGKRKFRCMACSKHFATLRNLKRHQKVHSGDNRKTVFPCPACGVKFTHKVSLNCHVKIHRGEGIEITACPDCPRMFLNSKDLEGHRKGDCQKKKSHKCSECHRSYRCRSELEQHKLVHQGQRTFKCDICEKAFSRKQTMDEHKRVHLAIKPYKCDQCSEAFKFQSNLKQHKLRHTQSRPHGCPTCKASFAAVASLQNHMKVHKSENPFLCSVCGRGFKQTSSLQLHLRIHSSDRPFKCVTCGASFKRADILQRHILTHTGGAPYKCTECGSGYRDRKSFKTHLLSHKKLKPFSCENCQKSFVDKNALRKHERLHTGEKAYKCSICDKAFALPQYLKRHVKTHNKIVDPNKKRKKRTQKAGVEGNSNKCNKSRENDLNLDTTPGDLIEQPEIVNIETSEITLGPGDAIELQTEKLIPVEPEIYPKNRVDLSATSLSVLHLVPSPQAVTSLMTMPRCDANNGMSGEHQETVSPSTNAYDESHRYAMLSRQEENEISASQNATTSCHSNASMSGLDNTVMTSPPSTPNIRSDTSFVTATQDTHDMAKKQEQQETHIISGNQVSAETTCLQPLSVASQNRPLPLLPLASHHAENDLTNATDIMTFQHADVRTSRPVEAASRPPTEMVMSRSLEMMMSHPPKMMMSRTLEMMTSQPQEMMMSQNPGMMTVRPPEMMTNVPKEHPMIYSRGDFVHRRNLTVSRNDAGSLGRKSHEDFRRPISIVASMQRESATPFPQEVQKDSQFMELSKEVLLSNQRDTVPPGNRDNIPLYQRSSQLQSHSFIVNPENALRMDYNFPDSNPNQGSYPTSTDPRIVNYSMYNNNTTNQLPNITVNSKMQTTNYSLPGSFQSHPQCLTVASTHQTSTSSLYHTNENMTYTRSISPHANPLHANTFTPGDYNQTLNLKTGKETGHPEPPPEGRFLLSSYGPHENSLIPLPGLGFPSSNVSMAGSDQEGDYSLMNDAYAIQHGPMPMPSGGTSQRHVPISRLVQDLQKKN